MKFAMVCLYAVLALFNLGQAVAAAFFGYVPSDSSVAVAAFIGASGAFMVAAKEAAR